MMPSSSSCAPSEITPKKTLLRRRVAEDIGGCSPDSKRPRKDGEHCDQEMEWRIEQVLGPLRNDFEKGIWGDRLGPQFGGHGSFLPAYITHSFAQVPVSERKVVEDTVDDRVEGALGPMFGGYGSFLPAEIRKPKPPVPASLQAQIQKAKASIPMSLPAQIQKAKPFIPMSLPAQIQKAKPPIPMSLPVPIQKVKPPIPTSLPAQFQKAKPPIPMSLPAQIPKAKSLVSKLLPCEKPVATTKPVAITAPPVQSNGSEKKRVPIDSLLEDIKKGKSFKLRVVFGSEKKMQKAVGEEAHKCPDVTPLGFDSSTGRRSRTRKQPSGMAQKMKKISTIVKRINRSHCPAAYVRGKMPRLC